MIAIAIDGPSGAGKSSLSRKAAERFGFIYVDTGAIYRTIGLAAQKRGVDTKDAKAVIAMLPTLEIALDYGPNGEQRMLLSGEDVSRDIRLPEVSMLASDVSAIQEVRTYLVDMQRELAKKHNVIMDGRDIGTVILPNAQLKIFLTADVEDRAKRRCAELNARGTSESMEKVLEDMRKRDKQDSERAAAPLKAADDAVVLDTTGNSFEQSLAEICRLISERTGLEPAGEK